MRTLFRLNPQFDNPVWRSWLQQLPEMVASLPAEALIQGGRNDVYRIEMDGYPLIAKCFYNRGAWKKVAYRFASSKARRSYEHSERLLKIGLRSPTPIAWREDWSGPWLENGYYICDYIDFEHEARRLNDRPRQEAIEKSRAAGRDFAEMHNSGIRHLDLTPGNLLFPKTQSDDYQPYIIDNNRMRFASIGVKEGILSLLQLELEGELRDALIDGYARSRNITSERCRELYEQGLRRHQLKWRIKNGTRPLRRKIGL